MQATGALLKGSSSNLSNSTEDVMSENKLEDITESRLSASGEETEDAKAESNDEDLLAELNANLANIIQKDKVKKQKKAMFKIQNEDGEPVVEILGPGKK